MKAFTCLDFDANCNSAFNGLEANEEKNENFLIKTLKDLSKVERFVTAVPELRNSTNYFSFSVNKQQQEIFT